MYGQHGAGGVGGTEEHPNVVLGDLLASDVELGAGEAVEPGVERGIAAAEHCPAGDTAIASLGGPSTQDELSSYRLRGQSSRGGRLLVSRPQRVDYQSQFPAQLLHRKVSTETGLQSQLVDA